MTKDFDSLTRHREYSLDDLDMFAARVCDCSQCGDITHALKLVETKQTQVSTSQAVLESSYMLSKRVLRRMHAKHDDLVKRYCESESYLRDRLTQLELNSWSAFCACPTTPQESNQKKEAGWHYLRCLRSLCELMRDLSHLQASLALGVIEGRMIETIKERNDTESFAGRLCALSDETKQPLRFVLPLHQSGTVHAFKYVSRLQCNAWGLRHDVEKYMSERFDFGREKHCGLWRSFLRLSNYVADSPPSKEALNAVNAASLIASE